MTQIAASRPESEPEFWPVDRVVIAYNIGLAILWIVGLPRASFAPYLVVAHLFAASIPFIFERIEWRSSTVLSWLRHLYPIALVALNWTEVGAIRDTFYDEVYDDIVLGAERAVFGFLPHEVLLPAMPYLWLGEIMQVLYAMYYPIVFLTPVVVVVARHESARDIVFNIFLTYIVCYISFALFPVEGPRFTMTPFAGEHTTGFFHRFAESLHAGGDQTGGAFPSTHVAASMTVALLAWRWFSRPLALIFTIGVIGVTVSTVYLQNHYTSDSIVGLLVGVVTYYGIAPLLTKMKPGGQTRGHRLPRSSDHPVIPAPDRISPA